MGMTHVLLPTDFSNTALNAAKFAFDLFGTQGNKFTLVHTYLKPVFDNALLPGLGKIPEREALNGLRRFERNCRHYAGKVVLAKKTSNRRLTDVLNEIHRSKGADLIVIGTQGEGNYGRVGTNTTAVVTGATAPVISVPSEWRPVPVQRIMFAYDGETLDRSTLTPMIELARNKNAEIVLAHVRYLMPGAKDRAAKDRMEDLFSDVKHSFVTVQGSDMTRTIDELATSGKIQLVAVVHRQVGFWKGLFHSSKAKKMALHATLPLMVLPERPRGNEQPPLTLT